MIKEVVGDLLSYDADIICHQTNYYGVMGGGIALAIRSYVLSDSAFNQYRQACKLGGKKLLGKVLYLPALNKNEDAVIVANLFCQDGPLRRDGVLTHYAAMRLCLQQIARFAETQNYSVALPGYMGCGIAGGDWATVRQIVEDVFGQSPVPLTIVYWEKEE